jgi:hypothetical protein
VGGHPCRGKAGHRCQPVAKPSGECSIVKSGSRQYDGGVGLYQRDTS